MDRNALSLLKIATATTVSVGLLAIPLRWREAQHPTFSLAAQSGPLADVMTMGTAINEKSEITGTAFNPEEKLVRAFILSGRDGKVLPLPKGADISVGADINDRSEVSGTVAAEGTEGSVRGVVWRGGNVSTLEKDGMQTMAVGLTDTGVAVGTAFSDRDVHAVAWKASGEAITLGSFVARGSSNNAAVGYSVAGDKPTPVSFSGGKLTKLPVPGGAAGVAFGTSDKAGAVGAVANRDGDPIPAQWQGDKLTILRTLNGGHGLATGINDRGVAVGLCDTKNGDVHACLWRGGKVMDLNEAINDKDWVLATASDINSKGEIVGTAVNQKARRVSAYVLRVR